MLGPDRAFEHLQGRVVRAGQLLHSSTGTCDRAAPAACRQAVRIACRHRGPQGRDAAAGATLQPSMLAHLADVVTATSRNRKAAP